MPAEGNGSELASPSAAAVPPYRARSIPWSNVVKFHKEIAARAEESFFSLRGDEDQDERWSSIRTFEPHELAGPWLISRSSIQSQPFQLELDQRKQETVFLGGPCYLGWEKSEGGKWFARWRPILYREVRLEAVGNAFRVVPDQAHWALSPLIYAMIDQRQISPPVPLERLGDEILEKARALVETSGLPPHEAVLRAVVGLLPGLKDDLTKVVKPNHFKVAPSPWVLFAPTSSYSALTRHLMRDYEELDQIISEDAARIGGLSLLEEREAPARKDAEDVLPVVPLNESQRAAVCAILGNRPITVVSGPPGCGKSQVVVSVLLNCWARGQSVLFASNNNKAVDVVRERLERFESQFPIAVRAGNRQVNNVLEVLRRTLNMARDGSTETDPETFRRRRLRIEEERARLERFLRDGAPARIDEAFKGALTAYAESRRLQVEAAQLRTTIRSEFEALRLGAVAPDDARRALQSTESWIESLEAVESTCRNDEQLRARFQSEASRAVHSRNEALARIGVQVAADDGCAWLLSGPHPTLVSAWLDRFRTELLSPIDSSLEEIAWTEEFNRWRDSKTATRIAEESRALAADLRACCAETEPQHAVIETLRSERDVALAAVAEEGVDADVVVDESALANWSSAWAELCALHKAWNDFMPWSPRSRLVRVLADNEKVLRRALPLAVWTRLGALDDSGRARLAKTVERTRRWLKARTKWSDSESRRSEVEGRFTALRARGVQLGGVDLPLTSSPHDWRLRIREFEQLALDAGEAATAWARREGQQAVRLRLARVAGEWASIASGVPPKEAWAAGLGVQFDGAVRALGSNQDLETVKRARAQLYSASLSVLIDAWTEAVEHQKAVQSSTDSANLVPSRESRVAAWWSGRPATSVVELARSGGLPTAQELGQARARFGEVRRWCDRWDSFHRVQEPEILDRSRKERSYANERLARVVEMLPADTEFEEFRGMAHRAREGDWPIEALRAGVARFDPARIRATIGQLDAQLERGSFDDAKASWLERLRTDQGAIRAVNELERVLSRQHVQTKREQLPLFRDALKLVPIWITTAQAAQAIPLDAELFDLVVIDEASQCTLTNLLPLVFRGKRIAVIGDSEQLPAIPTIREMEQLALAKKHGVEDYLTVIGHAANDVYKTATETLPRRRADVLMLDEHYRSHPQIIGFSNQHIYQHRLQLLKPPSKDGNLPFAFGVHRVHVIGEAERGEDGRSWVNRPEADKVVELVGKLRATAGGERSIGVVTPFAAQKYLLRERMQQLGLSAEVLVDTAYGFQGDERDVIIFSPVVAKGIQENSARWVESPPNLVNVALTRAKDALFVVADFDALAGQQGVLGKLARYCRDIQLLRDTSPAELALFSWMTIEGWSPLVHPRIGDHEVDFVLKGELGTQVAIEVDGRQHHSESVEADSAIDAYLEGQGLRVCRVPARLVLEAPHEVIHHVRQMLGS